MEQIIRVNFSCLGCVDIAKLSGNSFVTSELLEYFGELEINKSMNVYSLMNTVKSEYYNSFTKKGCELTVCGNFQMDVDIIESCIVHQTRHSLHILGTSFVIKIQGVELYEPINFITTL